MDTESAAGNDLSHSLATVSTASGGRCAETAHSDRSKEVGGKHSSYAADGRLRYRMTPVVAVGLALVVVLLATLGLWRGVAGDAQSMGPGLPVQSGGAVQDMGYGLAEASRGEGDGLIVHVVGAVKEPGIVELPAGARVVDAIDAAGGVGPDADTGVLNLAAFVSDGTQITVPKVGEVLPSGEVANAVAGGGCVDLNTASEEELQTLDGVGPKIAARIVAWRGGAGPIQTAAQLTGVPGIGSTLAERISAGTCQ